MGADQMTQKDVVRDLNRPSELVYFCGVSWPRSGHHLLVRILTAYFGDRFSYCEHYTPSDCCKTVPCDRAGMISLSKNHDRESIVPILRGGRYLVQFREFCPSVVSNFELYVRNTKKDSPRSFRKFANKQAARYVRFMERWATADVDDATFVRVAYERLTASPTETMETLTKLFAPNELPDKNRLAASIESTERITVRGSLEQPEAEHGVLASRDISTFRYFDADFFRRLDEHTRPAYERIAALPVVVQRPRVGHQLGAENSAYRTHLREPSNIYVDATGLLAQRGIAPTGIPRVQRFLAQQALDDSDPQVRVVLFDPLEKAYRPVTDREAKYLSESGLKAAEEQRPLRRRHGELYDALDIINENSDLGRDFDRYFAARISNSRPGDPRFLIAKIGIRGYRSFRRLVDTPRHLRTTETTKVDAANSIVLMSHIALFSSLFSETMSATRRRAFVCHDLIPWLHPEFIGDQRQAKRFVARLRLLVKSGAHALCTSNTSREMLSQFLAEAEASRLPISQFRLPSTLFETAESLRRVTRIETTPPFILYCSTVEARKNHLLLAKIWKRAIDDGHPLPKLVCAGKWGWGIEELDAYLKANPELSQSVELRGPVNDKELINLYRGALFGLMPSHIEGWGLTASECLDFGVPVIVSTAPALQEAVQGLMPAIDPDDEDAWYSHIRQLAESKPARDTLRAEIAANYRPVTSQESWQTIKTALRTSP